MISSDEIMRELKNTLKPTRFFHTLGVMITASELACRYGENREEARLAALLHDCSRNGMDEQEMKQLAERSLFVDEYKDMTRGVNLLHSVASEVLAREKYGVGNKKVLSAIRFHTTGRYNMTRLEMIVYSADMIEPSRQFEGLEKLRGLAGSGIEELTYGCCLHTVKYLEEKKEPIHGATLDLLRYLKENKGII